MILAGGQCQHVLTVGHHDEARFLAFEELLEHDAMTGVAELAAGEHHVDHRVGFVGRQRDHDALAGRQAIGLDDDRRALRIDVGMCRRSFGEGLEPGRGDAMPQHEALGEILRGFELRRGLRRAEDFQPGGTEGVDDAGGKRRLGSHHGECDALVARESDQFVESAQWDVLDTFLLRSTRIAGSDKHLEHARRLRQLPSQCVLTSAGTDDQDFHASACVQ